jgi:hypothetical protein
MLRGVFRYLAFLALSAHLIAAPLQIRVATFNASLNRTSQGQLATDLSTTANAQAKKVAEIIQRNLPDVLLLNEFDVDPTSAATRVQALNLFHDNYLAVSQNGQTALNYPYRYAAISNTGVAAGFDFDNSGSFTTTIPAVGATDASKNLYGNDCFGFGWFPGQYSFAVYSKYPIQTSAIRSFQNFKWKDLPGAVLPDNVATSTIPADYYSTAELNVFRLSSKSHVDVPIEVTPGQVFHLLASHPTPPAFDGTEDRNGRRNHDEIRLWKEYIGNASFLYDDAGVFGGLSAANGEQRFVVLGDMNADPFDGDSYNSAISQLRNHALVNSAPNPASAGGAEQGALLGGANANDIGLHANDTSFFAAAGTGNLRIDHVLPSKAGFSVAASGVFWPASTDPLYGLLFTSASYTQANQVTDHRLVWMDLVLSPVLSQCVRGLSALRVGDDVQLTWGSQQGISYKVEWSANLVQWFETPGIPVIINTTTNTATATDAAVGAQTSKFYRIVATLSAE